jgi:5-(aminomethyl)-3-furanmethanol phosphate kinase
LQTTIIKVGGSLFDHPALGPELSRFVAQQTGRTLIVPGGGRAADVVRQYHHVHHPPEEFSHWLAIRMMDANGELLRHFLNGAAEVVNCLNFCQADEGGPLALSHDWRVTSDAIAARVAEQTQANELVMLKSIALPEGIDWRQAAERGLVDVMFGEIVERARLRVTWLNFRNQLDALGST